MMIENLIWLGLAVAAMAFGFGILGLLAEIFE